MKLALRYYSKFSKFEYLEKLRNQHIEFPSLKSLYRDRLVQNTLNSLSSDVVTDIKSDLKQFSNKLENEYCQLHRECEENEPYMKHYDGWGRRIDEVITCPAWNKLKEITSKQGLVAIPYENNSASLSRLHQGLKLMMFSPFSGLYSCPIAMTDGAAFVTKKFVDSNAEISGAYHHMTSRQPAQFWTSGQWMTEKAGGSDVAYATTTVALSEATGRDRPYGYNLYGYKWFTSATDADMALTLARSLDADGNPIPGGSGLSLYFLKTRRDSKSTGQISSDRVSDSVANQWNDLEVVRLKKKLGTRQLPTAELVLNGSKAIKLCETGRGISSISGMLTITRLHNSITAVSYMRHAFQLAMNYAKSRECFGQPIIQKPLHIATLGRIDIESRAGFYLVVEFLKLLGSLENETHLKCREDEIMLRLLGPLVKLYTAKQALTVVQECMECIGGQAFMEDSGLAGLMRDTHVLPIWEGTTNILSLDLLRAIDQREFNTHENLPGSLVVFRQRCCDKLAKCKSYSQFSDNILASLDLVLNEFIAKNLAHVDILQLHARQLAYALTEIYSAVLFMEAACSKNSNETDKFAIQYWMSKDLTNGLGSKDGSSSKVDWTKFII